MRDSSWFQGTFPLWYWLVVSSLVPPGGVSGERMEGVGALKVDIFDTTWQKQGDMQSLTLLMFKWVLSFVFFVVCFVRLSCLSLQLVFFSWYEKYQIPRHSVSKNPGIWNWKGGPHATVSNPWTLAPGAGIKSYYVSYLQKHWGPQGVLILDVPWWQWVTPFLIWLLATHFFRTQLQCSLKSHKPETAPHTAACQDGSGWCSHTEDGVAYCATPATCYRIGEERTGPALHLHLRR